MNDRPTADDGTTKSATTGAVRLLAARKLRVLHISDLHIRAGDVSGDKIKNVLWQRLFAPSVQSHEPLCDADLCIVTGDLASKSPDAKVYRALGAALEKLFPCHDSSRTRRWIVLPGNHDRRWLGNFFLDTTTFEETFPQWNAPWWHPEHPLVIVPIDSNPTGDRGGNVSYALPLARGRVAESELTRIRAALVEIQSDVEKHYEQVLAAKSGAARGAVALRLYGAFDLQEMAELRRVFHGDPAARLPTPITHTLALTLAKIFMARAVRCVALHHHPVGIANTEELGLTNQEAYLTLTNAGDFLAKCREEGIDLVCHGHKHMPHRTLLGLPSEDGDDDRPRLLGVVGSGSTTLSEELSHASGNLIAVDPSGRATVTLVSARSDGFGGSKTKLVVRSREQARSKLHECARAAKLKCDALDVELVILPTGDARVTNYYRGVTFTDSHWKHGDLHFPIEIFGGAHGSLESVADIDESDLQFIGEAHLECDSTSQPGHWHGFVVVPIANCDLHPSITLRFTLFAAFATNAWQFRCKYGSAAKPESYSWTCRLPIMKRAEFVLTALDPLSFSQPHAKCEDLDDQPDGAEVASMRVHDSPGRDAVYLQIERPLWGWTYTVEWTWVGAQAPRASTEGTRQRRFADTAKLGGVAQSPPGKAALDCVRRVASAQGTEICVYVMREGDGHDGAVLAPLVWSENVEEHGIADITFKIGEGVAGRAAWLRTPVSWAASGAGWEPRPEADFYLQRRVGSQHRGVLTIPLGNQDEPFGVLSIASTHDDAFVEGIRAALLRAEPVPFPPWTVDLANELEHLLADPLASS